MRVASMANGASMDALTLQPELQFARCMSNRYRSEQFTLHLLYPTLGRRYVSFPRHPLLPQRQSTQHRRSQLRRKPQARCSEYELPRSMECSTDHCAHTADEGDPLQCITPDHANLIISILENRCAGIATDPPKGIGASSDSANYSADKRERSSGNMW